MHCRGSHGITILNAKGRLEGRDDNIGGIANNPETLGKSRKNVSMPTWASLTLFAGGPALKQHQAFAGTVGLLTGAQLMESSLNQQCLSNNQSMAPPDTALH